MTKAYNYLTILLRSCYCRVEKNLKYFEDQLTKEELEDLKRQIQQAKDKEDE